MTNTEIKQKLKAVIEELKQAIFVINSQEIANGVDAINLQTNQLQILHNEIKEEKEVGYCQR